MLARRDFPGRPEIGLGRMELLNRLVANQPQPIVLSLALVTIGSGTQWDAGVTREGGRGN